MADTRKLFLSEIKAFSKEQRQLFAHQIRRDQTLWNAVNGMGGLSEQSKNGLVQGTITRTSILEPDASISLINKREVETIAKVDQRGYFSVELPVDGYIVKVISKGDVSEEIGLETRAGETSTLNYNFK